MPFFSFCVFCGWMVKNRIVKLANINVKAAQKVKTCHRNIPWKNVQDKKVCLWKEDILKKRCWDKSIINKIKIKFLPYVGHRVKGVHNNKTIFFKFFAYVTVSYKVVTEGTPNSFLLSASFSVWKSHLTKSPPRHYMTLFRFTEKARRFMLHIWTAACWLVIFPSTYSRALSSFQRSVIRKRFITKLVFNGRDMRREIFCSHRGEDITYVIY